MAWDHHRLRTGPLQLRGESGRLVAPEDFAGRILNMELTEAGTLRSVVGPVEYHPADYLDDQGAIPLPSSTAYSEPHLGIFHLQVEGGKRDILLAHFSGAIRVHFGWEPGWHNLIGPALAEYTAALPEDDGRPGFLTQFEATPNGVVIVPQGGRAYFYNGSHVAPLGFDTAPGPPSPLGPRSTQDDGANIPDGLAGEYTDVANAGGFYKSGRTLNEVMGDGRLGTLRNDAVSVDGASRKQNPIGGILESGEWRAAVQYVDFFGNLSPVSPLSAPIKVVKEDNLTKIKGADNDERADRLRVAISWTDVDRGPPHTIGRQLLRTKDLLSSGTAQLFKVPPNATASALTLATVHDNTTEIIPDNIPDSWLLIPAKRPVPVPIFRLCKVAFGRLWIANTREQPGLLRPSEPGFWGTFLENMEIYPDTRGAEITGLWTVAQGLLVFTDTSTFLVQQGDEGIHFRTSTLNPYIGCVAPDSLQSLPNGMTVWLGRDGFYGFDGTQVLQLSGDIKESVIQRINKNWRVRACSAVDPRMGEYRCWIPVDGAQVNNLCVVYDGQGWRERTDVQAAAVATTRDKRQYMIALGRAVTGATPAPGHASTWLLDHAAENGAEVPSARESIVETTWLRNAKSRRRASPLRVTVWVRETCLDTMSVQAYRDWREHPAAGTGTGNPPYLYPEDDVPRTWDDVSFDATYVNPMLKPDTTPIPQHYTKRRPTWVKLDLHIPSCETFKLRFSFIGDWDFIGLQYEEVDRDVGGAKIPGRG